MKFLTDCWHCGKFVIVNPNIYNFYCPHCTALCYLYDCKEEK